MLGQLASSKGLERTARGWAAVRQVEPSGELALAPVEQFYQVGPWLERRADVELRQPPAAAWVLSLEEMLPVEGDGARACRGRGGV